MDTKKKLAIVFSGTSPAELKVLFKAKPVKWVYCGNDFIKCRQFIRDLGPDFEYQDVIREYFEIAQELDLDYVKWVNEADAKYGSLTEWWFGSLSSRNEEQSRLFRYACYLELLKKIASDPQRKPDMVVVPSRGVAQTVRLWALREGYDVQMVGEGKAQVRFLAKMIHTFLRWGKFVVIMLSRCLAAKIIVPRKAAASQKKFDLVVTTIVHDDDLSQQGVFTDRHFPALYEYLRKQGVKLAVTPLFYIFGFNYFSLYRRLRRSETSFLIPEDVLNIKDFLWVWTYPLRVWGQKPKVQEFKGFDLGPLIDEDFWEETLVVGLQSAYVYRWMLGLSGKSYHFSQAMTWYENRIEDRAMVMGLRRGFPGTRIIGARLFLHWPLHLNSCPTEVEVSHGIVPDLLLANSKEECMKSQAYTSSVECQAVPSLRFAHMFEDDHSTDPVQLADQGILIALPYKISAAVELLELVHEAVRELPEDIRIYVRPHPNYQIEEVWKACGPRSLWTKRLETASGPLPQVLKQSSMVISFPSNIIVESAIKGVPVIFVYGQTILDQNPLKDDALDWVAECYSSSELAVAIKSFLHFTTEDRLRFRESGRQLRGSYFSPVNDRTMQVFMDLIRK